MLPKGKSRWVLLIVTAFQMVVPFVQASPINEPDPTNPKPIGTRQVIDKTFTVNAEIKNGCIFDKDSYQINLVFDAANNTASSVEKMVAVSCTLNSNLMLSLDNGLHFDGTSKRLENANGDYVPYSLTMSEESGGAGVTQLTHTFSSQGVEYKFYVRATANIERAKVGYYQDTVSFVTSF